MTIELDDFVRRFSMRGGNLMWLLGAGASASAGIPTAWDMIGEFKQQLYVSQRRVSPGTVADLANPAVRAQLQAYIDASGRFPPEDSPDEYAALFEAAWPSETDRRAFIDSKIRGAKPSYGHVALATLMRGGITRIVWTTNFDTLVADACAKVFDGTSALTTVALDAPDIASQTIADQRWPVEIKLHGDFRSRRLKNTSDELRQQDARLRQVLIDASRTSGLIVAGYSGRDDSIMETLKDALSQPNPFPGGLFWLHRGDGAPPARVQALLDLAAEKGVDGGVVEIVNFDETLRDIIRLTSGLDTTVLDQFAAERRRWSPATKPGGVKGWPVIRLNGLPIKQAPTLCRRVVCTIGGVAEVRTAVEQAGRNVLVGRTQRGVLCFGSDADVHACFDPYNVTAFDFHTIEEHRLRFDSGERGLLRLALSTALGREHGLLVTKHRNTDLLSPQDPADQKWKGLVDLVGPLTGTVKGHPSLIWREGVGVRLEWADDRLWLVVEPRIVFDGMTPENRAAASDFGRERTFRRYNRQLNDLVSFWAPTLARGGAELRALGIGNGVDASFQLSADTAYSRRIGA